MGDILLIKKEWRKQIPELSGVFDVVEYREDAFNDTIRDISVDDDDRIIIINDYHPELVRILNAIVFERTGHIIRIEPQPFTHPTCHFSGFFLFSILWLLKNPELVSAHSYMTLVPGNVFNTEEVQKIVYASHSAGALNLGILVFARHKDLKVKRIHVTPERPPGILYEVLKNEFIHSAATLMKVLEVTRPDPSSADVKIDRFNIKHHTKLQVPGRPFLTREFISGFRKYAPFWKEHLYEDHFALLSAIYAGKEDRPIDDRVWIRIMIEFLNASLQYPDKIKVARRMFPIYALYLNAINETSINKKFVSYIEILKEEYGLTNN